MPVWLHSIFLHPKHYILIAVFIFVGLCILGALAPGKGRSGPRNVDSSYPGQCVWCKGHGYFQFGQQPHSGRTRTSEMCFHCKGTGKNTGKDYVD
jgi:hypothetical protein